jgi:multidrug efflux pump subunit AcrB
MGIVELSLRRRVTVAMVAIAVMLFGLVAFTRLPINLLPDISYPTLTVETRFPGAAPAEVESLVTRPVEEAVGVVAGVERMSSVSRPGLSQVTLELGWGRNMDFAALDVRQKLELLTLPQEAEQPVLLRFDPENAPILRLYVAAAAPAAPGEAGEAGAEGGAAPAAPAPVPDLYQLRYAGEEVIKKDLESTEGLAAVQVLGGYEEEIEVRVDEGKLALLGLSIGEVRDRLGRENVNQAGGSLYEEEARYLVRSRNEFETLGDILGTVVLARDGRVVTLADVATVERGHKRREVVTRYGGREAVELALYKEGDANTVTVARAVAERLERTRQELPAGIQVVAGADQSRFIQASIREVLSNAFLGGVIAIAVLLLFLRDARSTLVIGLSIPLSIVATFFLMYRTGTTLNIMSLGGLALGVGMLVDNAIVVLEAIYRRREEGLPAFEAARKGASEVGRAVTASTLTTVAVFLPVVFLEGVAAQLFRDQALTVSFSLMASLAVALTVIPVLAAVWMGKGRRVEEPSSPGHPEPVPPCHPACPERSRRKRTRRIWEGGGSEREDGSRDVSAPPPRSFAALRMTEQEGEGGRGPRAEASSALTGTGNEAPPCHPERSEGSGGGDDAGRSTQILPTVPLPDPSHSLPSAALRTGRMTGPEEEVGLVRRFGRLLGLALRRAGRFAGLALPAFLVTMVRLPLSWLGRGLAFLFAPVGRGFDRLLGGVTGAYPRLLGRALDHPWLVLAASLAAFGATAALVPTLGVDLIPTLAQGEFSFRVELPEGTPLEVTDRYLASVQEVLAGDRRVESFASAAGGAGLTLTSTGTEGENVGRLQVRMATGSSPEDEAAVAAALRERLEATGAAGGARYRFERPSVFTLRTPVEVEVYGDRLPELHAAAAEVRSALDGVRGLSDLRSSAELGNPELQVTFQRDQLVQLGLDLGQVVETVRNKVQGEVATRFSEADREIDVRVRALPAASASLADVGELIVGQGRLGGPSETQTVPIRLKSVAEIQVAEGPSEIRRIGQKRAAVVGAELVGRDMGAVAADVEAALGELTLPLGVTTVLAGEHEEMARSLRSLMLALGLAAFLVYLVMAAQFESFLHPFVIAFTLPLGAVGAVLGLAVTGHTVNVVALIGVVMLTGIVVNNAIVLVDTVNQLRREEGLDKRSALIEAGKRRLRPILMTSATTVLGLLPMALGLGEGAELRAPLAVTVIGGLTVATVLTLVVIPVVYSVLDRKRLPADLRSVAAVEPAPGAGFDTLPGVAGTSEATP